MHIVIEVKIFWQFVNFLFGKNLQKQIAHYIAGLFFLSTTDKIKTRTKTENQISLHEVGQIWYFDIAFCRYLAPEFPTEAV